MVDMLANPSKLGMSHEYWWFHRICCHTTTHRNCDIHVYGIYNHVTMTLSFLHWQGENNVEP